jgi:RNA polymerase sigma factor (sigma-70 family)
VITQTFPLLFLKNTVTYPLFTATNKGSGVMIKTQDQEIINQLRHDDINMPVQLLYQTYFTDITKLICINGGSTEDAADIFQETVLVFIDMVKANRYRKESSIRTFLYAVARNLWKQELRSRGRRSTREIAYSNSDEQVSYETEVRFFNKDMQHILETVYKEIGDTCKSILKGFYYEELSMKDLLKRFNYESEQALRNRKSLCMKKIKDILQKNNTLLNSFKNLLFYEK